MNETDYDRFLEFLKHIEVPYKLEYDGDYWWIELKESLVEPKKKSGAVSFSFSNDCNKRFVSIASEDPIPSKDEENNQYSSFFMIYPA